MLPKIATSILSVLVIVLSPPLSRTAFAEEGAITQRAPEAEIQPALEPSIDYAISVFQGIFFHEIGHAIIATAQLPVLGYEEDAVDNFAQLALLEFYADRPKDLLIYVPHYMDFWNRMEDLGAVRIQDLSGDDMAAEHDFSTRRAARLACNIAGTSPDYLSEIGVSAGLSQEAIEDICTLSSERQLGQWRQVLQDHLAAPDHYGNSDESTAYLTAALGLPFEVTYHEWPGHEHSVQMLRDSEVLKESSKFLRSWIELPQNIRVIAAPCGFVNAFFTAQYGAVVMCYEMWEAAIDAGITYQAKEQ